MKAISDKYIVSQDFLINFLYLFFEDFTFAIFIVIHYYNLTSILMILDNYMLRIFSGWKHYDRKCCVTYRYSKYETGHTADKARID